MSVIIDDFVVYFSIIRMIKLSILFLFLKPLQKKYIYSFFSISFVYDSLFFIYT